MTDTLHSGVILIVDDDAQIRRALTTILASRDFQVFAASGGSEGLRLAAEHGPDLIVVDLAMPGMNGFELCRELRTWSEAPILVLSVKSDESDKIEALDIGADDYLTKPFSAGELLARVRALLRRSRTKSAPAPTIVVEDLKIDIAKRLAVRAGEELDLTRTEFDVLSYLALNSERVVTSKMILEKVWGPAYGGDAQTLRVHISHLRKKIEPIPAIPRYVITEPGVGYRFASP